MTTVETKYCGGCDDTKAVDEFHRDKAQRDGRATQCKTCVADRVAKWQERNPDRVRQTKRRSHNSRKRKHKASQMRSLYGIDIEVYEEMFERQGGKCAICLQPETIVRDGEPMKLSVDHCHDTNEIRGLLCSNCNNGLGRFKDNPDLLRAAIVYLEMSRVNDC